MIPGAYKRLPVVVTVDKKTNTTLVNCFTADVISQYAFGEPMGFVDQEDWEPNFATWVKSFFSSAYMMRHNALARTLGGFAIPLATMLSKDVKTVMDQMTVVIPKYVQAAINDPDNGRVFAELMDSKILPPEEMSVYRLSGEGFNFLLAGTETTAVCHPLSLLGKLRAHASYRLRSPSLLIISWRNRKRMHV